MDNFPSTDGTNDDTTDPPVKKSAALRFVSQESTDEISSANRKPSATASGSRAEDAICLLESSDEEEEKPKGRASTTQQPPDESDDDSDDEVLIVDPPSSRKPAPVAFKPSGMNKSSVPLLSSSKKPSDMKRGAHKRSNGSFKMAAAEYSIFLDDSSDDEFLMNSKPSGLGRSSANDSKPRAVVTSAKKPNPAPTDDTPSATTTLKLEISSSTPAIVATPATLDGATSNAASGGSGTNRTLSIVNPYAKTTPAFPAVSSTTPSSSARASLGVYYPQLRDRTPLHKDIRANIVLGFWKYARSRLVQNSYNQEKLESYMNRVVELAVCREDFPIRTFGEYAYRKTSYKVFRTGVQSKESYQSLLTDLESTHEFNLDIPVDVCNTSRKYFTICEACLVVIYEDIMMRWKQQHASIQQDHNEYTNPYLRPQEQERSPPPFPTDPKHQITVLSQFENWMSLVELIPKIDQRLRPECPARLTRDKDADHGASHYLKGSTRSAEFRQIEKLLSKQPSLVENGVEVLPEMGFLKSHTQRGQRFYELTPLGYQRAKFIRTRTLPAAVGHLRMSNLDRVEPKFQDICLAVDAREGGGQLGKKTLHEMCNVLDNIKMPYFVGTLSIGDYCFFSRNRLCPILVERKSVQDVANSIADGRWTSQKRRMYHGQFVFGYENCRMAFIIEGKLEKQQVTGGYMGSASYGVSKERFDEEIENLKAEGFDVMRTTSVENSMYELSRWTERVAADVQNGKLKLEYTYIEFVDLVKKIEPRTDFSRLAKYHAQQQRVAEAQRQREENTVILLDSDGEDGRGDFDNDSGGIRGVRPNNLDGKFARKQTLSSDEVPQNGDSKRTKLEGLNDDEEAFKRLPVARLQALCVECGLPKSGTKSELVKRLCGPRPPEVYCRRKKRGLYVPQQVDTAPTALLVGLQILQDSVTLEQEFAGATKDELYTLAENLSITKNPFSGGTTQTGPFLYDGWASMGKLIAPGDPSLVIMMKRRRYKLSTASDVSGLELARGMHKWCHDSSICRCQQLGYTYSL